MRNLLALFFYFAVLNNIGCTDNTLLQQPEIRGTPTQSVTPQETIITKEAAMKIAREGALATIGSLEKYEIVPCENEFLWRVFVEPTSSSSRIRGFEYVISKQSGRVIRQLELPLTTDMGVNIDKASPSTKNISRDDVLHIVKMDAVDAYGSVDSLEVSLCELTKVWRVVYSPKHGLNGGGPEYIVDKRTGRILDRKYYQ